MTLQDVLTGQTNATIGRQLNAWQSGRRNRFPSLRVFFRGIRRKSIRQKKSTLFHLDLDGFPERTFNISWLPH
jgi:hypothetical protein